MKIGKNESAQEFYDGLDETDRTQMQAAFEDAVPVFGVADRLINIATGDIILFHSIDRDMYAAIKAVKSEDDGNLTIEFKVSRY